MALTDNGNTVMTMPVAPTYGGGYGGGMGGFGGFGGDGWWVILLLICLGGWGNNGWGGNGGGTSDLAYLAMMNGAVPGYTQTNDFSNLERENDIIRQDICQNFAAVNQTLANGFQGIQTSFANAELSRSNTQAALMGQMYNMSMADLQRGCDTQSAISTGFAQTNYNLAQQGCDTRNTIQNTTRDVIDAQRDGTNAILAALNAQRIEQKDERIAELTNELAAARLSASQSAQNETLINTLRPCPVPSYQTCNPWGGGCNCGGMV